MKQPGAYVVASNTVKGLGNGFATRYGCKLLVWYELADTMEAAIIRDKQRPDRAPRSSP